MFESLFEFPFPFILIVILWISIYSLYFLIQKKNILSNYRQTDSKELKNISGTIITENGFLRKKIQWCSFDILINSNSIFLFSKNFHILPDRIINLVFSNSNKVNTKRSALLREFKISKNNIELIYYPHYLIGGQRKIYLKNLTDKQFSILENILNTKSKIH